MFPTTYLLILLAQPVGVAPRDEMTVSTGAATVDFSWADAEDRVQGSMTPRVPVDGQPLEISAHVGTFQGAEFDGPVTLTLKARGSSGGGQTKTVKRAQGERAWRVSFVPDDAGPHTLEISFRTTRMKVVSARIDVIDAKLSRLPWWILVGLLAAGALGLGVRAVFKKQENT